MALDHGGPVPLHVQAGVKLRQLIEQEEYKNGKLLPGEVELAKEFNISRNTLRQAINQMVFEGLLVRKKGVGTKVARKGIFGGAKNWLSFSEEMQHLGVTVRNYELHLSLKNPNEKIANVFGTTLDQKCVVLERLRGNTSFPFVYFISFFNPKLPISGEENFQQPLYQMLNKEYGIVVKLSKEEISARLAGEFLAGKLEIEASDPVLVRKRFVYDENGQAIEYNSGYYRADSFTYTIEAPR